MPADALKPDKYADANRFCIDPQVNNHPPSECLGFSIISRKDKIPLIFSRFAVLKLSLKNIKGYIE